MLILLDCRSVAHLKLTICPTRNKVKRPCYVSCVGNTVIGLFELGAIEQRSSQYGIGQIGFMQVCSSQICIRQICSVETVSYTHLRAHETRHDLVCRLLLEKKK